MTPETLFSASLMVHILSGSFGLLTGTAVLLLPKGNRLHKTFGKGFVAGLGVAGISGILLSFIHPNLFLFCIAVFSLYLILSGYRLASRKQTGNFSVFDKLLSVSMALTGLIMLAMGVINLSKGNLMGLVLCVFSGIALNMVWHERNFIFSSNAETSNPSISYSWVPLHLQRTIGGYIAALTAFLVVNAKYVPFSFPGWMFWLLPTIVLTPLIFYWSKKYSPK